MAIDAFAQQLVNALSLGSIYAVLALGLAMVYSTLGILNFAYGELITIVGYTMFFASEAGLPFIVMAALGIVVAGAASVAMQAVIFRPLRGANFVTLLFASFALSQVLQGSSGRRSRRAPRASRHLTCSATSSRSAASAWASWRSSPSRWR